VKEFKMSERNSAIEENEHKTEEDDMLCLITNKPLTEYYYKMDCGHKFNYVPLYLDIKNHKKKFNGMESSTGQLKQDEIRCPYCRKKQSGVLPYYEELSLEKVNGVNNICLDLKKQQETKVNTDYKPCQFLKLNPDFKQIEDNDKDKDSYSDKDKNGNMKYYKCYSYGYKFDCTNLKGEYNSDNTIIDYPVTTIIDNNHYCWKHNKQMIKKYKTDMLIKIKDDIKNKKMQDKENVKKSKEDAKQKEKEAKQKEKEKIRTELKKIVASSKKNEEIITDSENVVIGLVNLPENISQENVLLNKLCLEILKTGTKKGECCGSKIFIENVCKRHYNLKNKIVTPLEKKNEK
jgi:hypothetical protein